MSVRRKGVVDLGAVRLRGVSGIQIVTSAVANTTSSSGSVSYTMAQPGDLILVLTGWYHTIARSMTVSSAGLSFSTAVDSGAQTSGMQIAYAWQPDITSRAVSTATSSSISGQFGTVFVLRGVDPVTPVDVAGAHAAFTAATTVTPASVTSATSRALLFNAAIFADDNTPTSSWADAYTGNISTTAAYAAAWKTLGAAGSSDAATFTETTNNDDAGRYATLAIRAAQP